MIGLRLMNQAVYAAKACGNEKIRSRLVGAIFYFVVMKKRDGLQKIFV